MICSLNSPYASQIVILHKKTLEVHLCVDYRKQFHHHQGCISLPYIDEALQAVQQSNWFTSFDLVQRYLQLVMAEEDIKLWHLE